VDYDSDAQESETDAEDTPRGRPLQPERETEEDAPDRYRRVDQGGLGSGGHAHPEREGDVVRPYSDEAYARQGKDVPPTWSSVLRLEECYEREE
jgi:hypothetical protein